MITRRLFNAAAAMLPLSSVGSKATEKVHEPKLILEGGPTWAPIYEGDLIGNPRGRWLLVESMTADGTPAQTCAADANPMVAMRKEGYYLFGETVDGTAVAIDIDEYRLWQRCVLNLSRHNPEIPPQTPAMTRGLG